MVEEQNVLELSNIWKRIGKKMIIKNVAFSVGKGQVVGLLGPNGAGKTTLIRVIVALMQLDQGNIMIAGESLTKNYKEAIQHVGAIVENPEFYNYMSGYDNLMQYVRMARQEITPKQVDEVVKAVHLENNIQQKVKTYSLGMRQRLGVAQALLHRPSLLVLDEPMNGLDPKGMREFREMILGLRDQGIGVLISSHQLSDIELIADHLVILQKGEVTHKVAMAEVHQGQGNVIQVVTEDNAAALTLLNGAGFDHIQETAEGLFITSAQDERAKIAQIIVNGHVGLLELSMKRNSLEDVFLEWTEEGGL